jgi:hypothetical protein
VEVEVEAGETGASGALRSADLGTGTVKNVISVTLPAEMPVISVTPPNRRTRSPCLIVNISSGSSIGHREVTLKRFDQLLYLLNFSEFFTF